MINDKNKIKVQLASESLITCEDVAKMRQRIAELEALEAKRNQTEQELRHRNSELVLLNQVIAASAVNQESEAILDAICRELALAFDVPQTTAILLNKEKTSATVVAEYRLENRPTALHYSIPVAENPSFQYLLTHKAPLLVNDAQKDPRLASLHKVMRLRGTVSMLLLPLIINEAVVGCLDLDTFEPRHFSAEEISLAWNVADQVSGALARMKLNEEHRQLEAQYHQAQKMESLGQLTAGIAHDFNNLLMTINGFTELMQYELAPDNPLQESLAAVMRSGQRATKLVRQLLAFSRKQVIKPEVLDLNSVITEIHKMLRPIIGEDIQLETNLKSDLWLVKVDPTQMEQVIINLAVNARDAMPDGGRLTIEAINIMLDDDYVARHVGTKPGEYVLLAVTDTGHGMSQEVQSRIFEPFFTTKKVGKGTGLGLATVFGIIKQNEGHISVSSVEGAGTTFKIYFPRTEKFALVSTRPEAKTELHAGNKTILLVEDNSEVRSLIRQVLQKQGYALLEAQDGQEALQVTARHTGPIHLLLTDMIMPGMSGKSLAERLSQMRDNLKIMFISGYVDSEIMNEKPLNSDAVFLQKPFTPSTLARKVQDLLGDKG